MFWEIDIKNGIVEYDDISHFPDDFKKRDHIDYLKEDMLQIRFPNGVLIDVGWRPSFNVKGKFYIAAVKNGNWTSPIVQMKALDVVNLKKIINDIISRFT